MRIVGKATEHLNLIGIVLTLGIIVLISFAVDIATLKSAIAGAGVFAPLFFIAAKASTIVFAPLSGGPLYPIVGLLFGFWPGILYVALGDFLGLTIAFFLARIFGYPIVHKFIAKQEHSMLAKIVRHISTTRGFIHMMITCFALPELVAYGTGLSKFPYWKFITIFLPVTVVGASILVYVGSVLDQSEFPLLLSLGVPVLAGVVILIGGWLFVRGVRDES